MALILRSCVTSAGGVVRCEITPAVGKEQGRGLQRGHGVAATCLAEADLHLCDHGASDSNRIHERLKQRIRVGQHSGVAMDRGAGCLVHCQAGVAGEDACR